MGLGWLGSLIGFEQDEPLDDVSTFSVEIGLSVCFSFFENFEHAKIKIRKNKMIENFILEI
jgi:hypothetical protein